jgi:hypothetical protein
LVLIKPHHSQTLMFFSSPRILIIFKNQKKQKILKKY